MKFFIEGFVSLLIGLPLCAWLGWQAGGTMTAAWEALFVGAVLAVLEVSLSFDNAIVNASILRKMSELWRKRFLTWGMVIAVFGMRLVFPLVVVSLVATISPWQALVMAATEPKQYSDLMLGAHLEVSAFGGCFLLLVALRFFAQENKNHYWIRWLEKPVSMFGRVEAVEVGFTIAVLMVLCQKVEMIERTPFLLAGLAGIVTFILVDGLGVFLERWGAKAGSVHRASLGLFIYLEVLDASFSFDGVVGGFAITSNLFIIMIGLSIGAFFVRGLTLLMVERQTLQHFDYLEHGAYYAIAALAFLMLCAPIFDVPEWATGLTGAVFIAAAFIASLRARRQSPRGLNRE